MIPSKQYMLIGVLVAVLALILASTQTEAALKPPCGSKPADFRPIPQTSCKASSSLKKSQCTTLNRQCTCQYNAPLKWAGTTCPGQPGAGGCQCASFCGYSCLSKCKNDNVCAWNGACFNKATGGPGLTQQCYYTATPTTGKPTTSPTTSRPTASPTTSRPTKTPTTPQPTASPTVSTPTEAPTTSRPTHSPTISPTTSRPTSTPSKTPSKAPTGHPTPLPSKAPIIPTYVPSHGPGSAICKPNNGLDNTACQRRKVYCLSQDIVMKFVGPGCIKNGVRQHDSGCQCDQYCGYKCDTTCNNDKQVSLFDQHERAYRLTRNANQCMWNYNSSACYNKQTGELGVPITPCLERVGPIVG